MTTTTVHLQVGLLRKRLQFRTVFGWVMTGVVSLCTLLALAPVLAVLGFVLARGIRRLNLDLFTQLPPPPGWSGGGFGNALIGTLMVVLLGTVIAVPFGVLTAVYLSEFSNANAHQQQMARWVRLGVNVLAGVPAILAGVFAYGLLVATGILGYSAVAAGVALAVLMLPTVIRTADEALQLVPQEMRWASAGLGASHYDTVFRVVLPAALPSLLTGLLLAMARAMGESAALIFTALFSPFWPRSLLEPIATLSVLIYNYATVPYPAQQELAWAASFFLVLLILMASVVSRLVIRRHMQR
ncbi:MAG: phosphate ABC transporter permease PstA [Gloeomargarita sp. SKYBB_i_bin120]|nr:phosphate ABC transporter permease PstA [Gloeomargarita sp. SKYG98]MCS7291395.1 phosphate ABC transporter permease PstA [Gloeomargarita sp. SKYB120]MDW8176955.1 phosphate ABC transporter permease PstA [Gloeomargarita sp. SKYBB_i_bin120]